MTRIVEAIGAVLPGIVDPSCSKIPYAVYRFKLPYDPEQWEKIHLVVMSMTGFTVKVSERTYLQQG